MTLNDFLSRLNGVKPFNGYYMAMCPVHNTKDSSMSVKQADDGSILLHCHRGCDTRDIVDALGLKMSDLFADGRKGVSAAHDFKKIEKPVKTPWHPRDDVVASYEYRDDGGRVLAVKERYYKDKDGEKQQYWRHQDERGNWFYGAGDAVIPLYKHECIGNPVYLVEGEKDVDTLIAGGLHAVTNPNGAGEKWKDRYTEQLRGYDVAVIPDNDDIGKKHAQEVCTALHGVAASVRLLDLSQLWPDIPNKGDTTDYVEWRRSLGRDDKGIFHTIELLRDDTPEFVPDVPDVTEQQEEMPDIFKPVSSFTEAEAEWLVPGWIPKEQITIFASDGGVGKTTIDCNIIAAISSGGVCILDPEDVQREPQKVLLLTSEDSISKKLKKKLRLMGANMDNVIAPDPAEDSENAIRGLKFGSPFLARSIRELRPALCVFDPVQGYVPPDINMGARNAMRDCMASLTALGEETGCTFIVVCHSNKRRGASGRERISDSSDLWDIARSVIMAGFTNDREVRYLSNEKNNYAKLQETVLFSIDNNGLPEHKGFSDKHDHDFICQALTAQGERKPEEVNEKLLAALKAAASPFDTVRYHYADFEEKYGATIYGGKPAAKALDKMKPFMEAAGYSLIVKNVRVDGKVGKGFSITPVNDEPAQLPVCV